MAARCSCCAVLVLPWLLLTKAWVDVSALGVHLDGIVRAALFLRYGKLADCRLRSLMHHEMMDNLLTPRNSIEFRAQALLLAYSFGRKGLWGLATHCDADWVDGFGLPPVHIVSRQL